MINIILEYSATALSIMGLYLIAKKDYRGYVPWIIASPMWIALGIMTQSYGTAVTFSAYQIMNFYGLWQWKLKKNNKE